MPIEINGPANVIIGINHVRQLISEERYNEVFHILDLIEEDARYEISFLRMLFSEAEKAGIILKTKWMDAKKCSM